MTTSNSSPKAFQSLGAVSPPKACPCQSSHLRLVGCVSDDNGNNSTSHEVLCGTCVRYALKEAHERRAASLSDWKEARAKCVVYFQQDDIHEKGPAALLELQERRKVLI
jgi:hypothetical protein